MFEKSGNYLPRSKRIIIGLPIYSEAETVSPDIEEPQSSNRRPATREDLLEIADLPCFDTDERGRQFILNWANSAPSRDKLPDIPEA